VYLSEGYLYPRNSITTAIMERKNKKERKKKNISNNHIEALFAIAKIRNNPTSTNAGGIIKN
jgi:hypothetical protein